MKTYTFYFAQAYGSGSYGSGSYSCTTQQQQAGTCNTTTGATGGSTSGTSGNASGSGLTNTGIGILTIATLACLIIFVSLIVRIWRRKPTAEPVPVEDETTDAEEDTSDR